MAVIQYFGRFSDIATSGEATLPAHVSDTDALAEWLAQSNDRFAEELKRPGVSVVVNKEIVRGVAPVTDKDEIAFMSALSGG